MVLLVLLLVLIIVPYLMPYCIKSPNGLNDEFSAELDSFKLSLREKEKTRRTFERKTYEKPAPAQAKRFVFNPNELDSLGFISLGIKPFVVKNILNYRRKGGKFRRTEDFAKIYGMQAEIYQELEPYIRIETVVNILEDTLQKQLQQAETPKEFLTIELNNADTTALKQLRGIGSYYARQIVQHRKRLGGFVRAEQLLEIYNFRQETYEKILPHITIDTTHLVKINVNKASVEKLKAHPYLNFYSAKSIYEHRRKHKQLSSVSDLENLPDLPSEMLEKVKPYLEFVK
jgi:DNA uptake protein ComE-like DNA-binding protein